MYYSIEVIENMKKENIGFCKWFYGTHKEGIKTVSQFLIGCLGIYILFLMLTPFLPLFSNIPLTEYTWWIHISLYILVCLFSVGGLMFYFIIIGLYEDYVKATTGKKITFKVKPKWIVYTVAILIIFTYIGYNGGYGNGESDGYIDGFGEGIRISTTSYPPRLSYPASMSLSLELGIFDFSTDNNIERNITDIITIKNTDDERIVENPILMLYNPVTRKYGIPDNLKGISIKINGLELCSESSITGILLDDLLYPEENKSLTIYISLINYDVDTFQDNQEYVCYLFFYQSKAEYCDKIAFTIVT